MSVHYDAGALLAADRSDRTMWMEHRARLEVGVVPLTTAPVVAQVSRSPRQAQLHRLLRGCEVNPFTANESHPVGALLARTKTSDVVDAHLIYITRDDDTVVTSDPDDLHRLAGALNRRIHLRTA